MTTAKIEVPAVYTSLAAVLKNLSVEKNGTLPGNMGGKPYITAADTAAEVKRQFVDNDLIFLPNEEVIHHENLQANNRLQVSIVVTGTYTLLSTKDGSSVTVSGTGDGLATGTAVASNIASTNALKNALLRTFLITEQSVEDASKQGPAEASAASTPAQQKVERARAPKAPPANDLDALKAKIRDAIGAPKAPPANDLDALKAKIRDAIGAGKADKDEVNRIMTAGKADGLVGVALYNHIIAEAVTD